MRKCGASIPGGRRAAPRLSLPLSPEEREQVAALAERWGCSEAEAVRRAVREATAATPARAPAPG